MIYKIVTVLICFMHISSLTIFADSEQENKADAVLDISLLPEFTIPVAGSADIFEVGGGGQVAIQYSPNPFFFFDFHAGYNISPVRAELSTSRQWGGLGGGLAFPIMPGLRAGVTARGGGFYSFLNEDASQNGGNGYAGGGVHLDWQLFYPLHLKSEAFYRYFFGYAHEINISIGLSYSFDFVVVKALEQGETTLEPVYPVLINSYKTLPLGSVIIRNKENAPVKNLAVYFFMPGYMDKAVKCADIKRLDSGTSVEVSLSAIFRNNLMAVEKLIKTKAEIKASYSFEGRSTSEVFKESMIIHNRNTIQWDNPAKLGLFVTPADARISRFGGTLSNRIGDVKINNIHPIICKAMILFESLNLYGMSIIEADTISHSENEHLDTVLFPYQVLQSKKGKAHELVFLFCSVLESAGIPAAIIWSQDCIFPALLLVSDRSELDEVYSHPDDLIFHENKVWMPVDVTDFSKVFLNAVRSGATLWKNNNDKAEIFIVEEIQKEFPPPSLQGSADEISIPGPDMVGSAFQHQLDEYVAYEIEPRVNKLKSDIKKAGNNVVIQNRLGVLYAEYGLLDEAMNIFHSIVLKEEYVPALINMGTAYYLKDELIKAIPYFERALAMAPLEPVVLLSLAIINHRLENYGNAREAYKKLRSIDPELAENYSYIELKGDEARLAAQVSKENEKIVWIKE
jgi:hypothetical protein